MATSLHKYRRKYRRTEFLAFTRAFARENGLRDARSRVAEADEPREVGWTDTFLLGQCGKRRPATPGEGGVEAVRPDLISRACGVAVANGSGPVDQHPDLPPGTAPPRTRTRDASAIGPAGPCTRGCSAR